MKLEEIVTALQKNKVKRRNLLWNVLIKQVESDDWLFMYSWLYRGTI